MIRFICMSNNDNVATALQNAVEGNTAVIYNSANDIICKIDVYQNIPFGNKIAIADIKKSDNVIKYGEIIGQCTDDIKKGNLVHVHNVKSLIVDIPSAFKKEIMRQMNITKGGE